MGKRKKAGALASVVPDKTAKVGKFFFNLRLKGEGPVMSEKAKENVLRADGKVDAAGNVKAEEKPMVDPIDKSL